MKLCFSIMNEIFNFIMCNFTQKGFWLFKGIYRVSLPRTKVEMFEIKKKKFVESPELSLEYDQ